MRCGGSNRQYRRIMGTRLGTFKTKNAQIIVWENSGKLSFEFGKYYKDKQTQQWKSTKVLYADELREIGELFLNAAKWAANKQNAEALPKGVEETKTIANQIVTNIKERYERSSQDD
jgi:hypothetical protein